MWETENRPEVQTENNCPPCSEEVVVHTLYPFLPLNRRYYSINKNTALLCKGVFNTPENEWSKNVLEIDIDIPDTHIRRKFDTHSWEV